MCISVSMCFCVYVSMCAFICVLGAFHIEAIIPAEHLQYENLASKASVMSLITRVRSAVLNLHVCVHSVSLKGPA